MAYAGKPIDPDSDPDSDLDETKPQQDGDSPADGPPAFANTLWRGTPASHPPATPDGGPPT